MHSLVGALAARLDALEAGLAASDAAPPPSAGDGGGGMSEQEVMAAIERRACEIEAAVEARLQQPAAAENDAAASSLRGEMQSVEARHLPLASLVMARPPFSPSNVNRYPRFE